MGKKPRKNPWYNRHEKPEVPTYDGPKVIHFRSLEKPNEDVFCLQLFSMSGILSYEGVTESIASHLGLNDSTKIRLTSHNSYFKQPKSQPITYKGEIVTSNQTSDILYFEVLDIPLPALQCSQTLNVAFHHATKDEVLIRSITLTKKSTVGDLINDLKTKVELSHPNAELRLFEVYNQKICKIYRRGYEIVIIHNDEIVTTHNPQWTLRAEEIPEEEEHLGPLDQLIHVRRFCKNASRNKMEHQSFGDPFLVIIHEGETLAEVKVRIQKKLKVPDDIFSKWKFKFCTTGHEPLPGYLPDYDILSSRFQKRDVYEVCQQFLILEQSDCPPNTDATNQKVLKTEEKEEKEHKKLNAETHLYTIIKQEYDEILAPCSEYPEGLQPMEVVELVSATPMPCEITVHVPTIQSGDFRPLPEYPSAGQLYQGAGYRNEALLFAENFEEVGGFSILKSQALLYKRIWSKYGHIVSSQVMSASLYSAQIAVVAEIMTSITDMHHCHIAEVSSAMIDLWEEKIMVAEKLSFNIRWLRERFEDVKKDYYWNRKLKTSLAVQVQSLQTARERVLAAKYELKKAEEDVNVLESRISPLLSEERIYVEKGTRLLFDGLL